MTLPVLLAKLGDDPVCTVLSAVPVDGSIPSAATAASGEGGGGVWCSVPATLKNGIERKEGINYSMTARSQSEVYIDLEGGKRDGKMGERKSC